MNVDFFMPVRLITGENCIAGNTGLLRQLGERCIIITGKGSAVRSGALADVQAALEKEGIAWTIFDEVEPNPRVTTCHRAGERARAFGARFVVGIGGGSALDAAKAAAVFAASSMQPEEIYALPPDAPVLPIAAVGTTAGTGSEVTHVSVLTMSNGRKRSFNHPGCFPSVSFGDPRYTYSMPRLLTIGTALDALCHAVEGYFTRMANDSSDLFAVKSIEILLKALPRLEGPEEIPHSLRAELYYASVLAGVTLAHCGTSYPHRLSYFLSEDYGVHHGMACAAFLPDFLRRAACKTPERTAALFARAGGALEDTCALVERLTVYERPVTEDAALVEVARRNDGCANFINTAPDGYTFEEACQLLQKLYGKQ